MKSYFADPEKASEEELQAAIDLVHGSPVMSGLLHSVSGLLAVLNEHRQIIALNDSFLRTIGIDDPEKALGLRHGEAFQCIHAHDTEGGCGTTKFCSTCGAAVAIVGSLAGDVTMERMCALTAERNGKHVEIALLIRAQPIHVHGTKLLLLLAHDVTVEQRRAALERTFFHDINNMLCELLNACELLHHQDPNELTDTILEMATRLNGEVAIQQYLSSQEAGDYRATWRACSANSLLEETHRFFERHPALEAKVLDVATLESDVTFTTDTSAVFRILCNMILNAVEATEKGGRIRVWLEQQEESIVFHVWNPVFIPPEVQLRLFQRNFSTKAEAGRGIGTFSMKLLGEEVLGGHLDYTTSRTDGTEFRFEHPILDLPAS